MKAPRIDVLRITALEQGRVLALAAIRVNGVTIRHLRLVADPQHGATLQGPQLVTDTDGRRDYTTLVQFDKPLRAAIRAAVYRAYQQEKEEEIG